MKWVVCPHSEDKETDLSSEVKQQDTETRIKPYSVSFSGPQLPYLFISILPWVIVRSKESDRKGTDST